MYTWIAAGAVMVVLSAGAAMWLMSEGEKEIVLAGSAPLPASPAPAVALATEAPPVRGTADDVSTAAILDAGAKPAPVPEKKQADDELTRMFEQGKASAPSEVKAAAAPPPRPAPPRVVKPRQVAKAPVKKPVAEVSSPGASNVAPRPRVVATKKKPEAPAKAAAPVDSDVALLAALVAHSKATQPKGSSGVGAKLKQCKSHGSVAEANQCRARVCASARNEPECKGAG